jgi:hypothetical protein
MCATNTSQIPHLTPAPSPPLWGRGDFLLLPQAYKAGTGWPKAMRVGVIILYEIQITE